MTEQLTLGDVLNVSKIYLGDSGENHNCNVCGILNSILRQYLNQREEKGSQHRRRDTNRKNNGQQNN